MCPTEEFQRSEIIIFNEYFVESWLGDDSKIAMACAMSTQTLTNEQTTMLKDGIPSLQKWWRKRHPNIFQFMVAKYDAAIPPPHNKNN